MAGLGSDPTAGPRRSRAFLDQKPPPPGARPAHRSPRPERRGTAGARGLDGGVSGGGRGRGDRLHGNAAQPRSRLERRPCPGSRTAQHLARGACRRRDGGNAADLEDARQHISIPGTTGAGKTTTILSLLVNSLAQGSGFVLVDGKADRTLFGSVMGLARRFGREDDVRLLNLMVASGFKISNTFNAFAIGNADTVREVLASQLGEQASTDSNGIFRERAVALIASIAPALVWLRDHKDVPLTIDFIRSSIELIWIWKLAMEKTFKHRDYHSGTEIDVAVPDIPEDVIWPLKSYLGELPGYDASVPLSAQKGEEPSKQHGFAQFYFTPVFTQLTVSLGHIFRVDCGDIDMRDIVLNRRILVVNLPALEKL